MARTLATQAVNATPNPPPLAETCNMGAATARSDSSRNIAISATSTPTSRGQFRAFVPEESEGENDSGDEEPSFRFFRIRPRRIFDETAIGIPNQAVIESGEQTPSRWMDCDILLIKYIDDFNGVEKLYKRSAVMTYSEDRTCLLYTSPSPRD